MADDVKERIDEILGRLRGADWKSREAIKDQLMDVCKKAANRAAVREHLEGVRMGLTLEIRWEVDEVLAALAPPPAKAEEKPPEKPKNAQQVTAADLNLVYDDPRGLMVHKTKVGDRYFLTQPDPRTGRPQTFELHPAEVADLKAQLRGSPYWVLGSGEGA